MAITKRTRFEVLRRDGHRCQYCGTHAVEGASVLTIDHVVPVSLGGSDSPDNLVAACRDCNAGKSSIQPDSPFVAAVGVNAAAYALGMRQRMAEIKGALDKRDDDLFVFRNYWDAWTNAMGHTMPLPDDWKGSVTRWVGMGVPWNLFEYAIETAMTANHVTKHDKFRYMAGVIYRTIDEHQIDTALTAETARTFTKREVEDAMGEYYDKGFADGVMMRESLEYQRDVVAQHIDRVAA